MVLLGRLGLVFRVRLGLVLILNCWSYISCFGKVAVSWLKILAANPNPTILSQETATLPIHLYSVDGATVGQPCKDAFVIVYTHGQLCV